MDRNREARRATSIVGSNGFNKRRHRTNSLRDSPDEEGGIELQESARLRERVKKDRDRERERERERERDLRERERERDLRERSSRSSSKRRRAERLATNRDDIGGDETTDESFNEDDDDEDEHTATAAAAVRSFPPPPTAAPGSISNHHHHHQNHSFSTSFSQQHSSSSGNIMSSNNNHLQHRKSFPLSSSSAKVLRAPPVWKSGDEMISASVPRKARSASTKRLHDWISSSSNNNSSGGGVEQNPGQVSDSPVGQAPVSASPPLQIPAAAAPLSPSSSNASARKKLKTSITNPGQKLKPPQKVSSSSKPSSSNPEELEIEIAEVLYGLMTQSQGPSSSSKKEDSREVKNSEANTSSPLYAVAPKRKRPRQIPENSVYREAVPAKPMAEQMPKIEISSPNLEKISGSGGEIGYEMGGNSVISQAEPPVPAASELTKLDLELNSVVEESRENRDLVAKEEVTSPKEKESPALRTLRTLRTENSSNMDLQSTTVIKENLESPMEIRKEEKFEIDLMAPPPQVRSSPERENKIASKASTVDPKPIFSIDDALSVPKNKEDEKGSTNVAAEEKKGRGLIEEAESHKEIENKGRNIDLHLDLEKSEKDGSAGFNSTVNKSQPQIHKQLPFKPTKEEPPTDKSGHVTSSLPLPLPMPMSVANWPGGLPPMGYMAPLQGVVSMDGSGVTPSHMQPLFSQPRPKRCATHCHIARNIHCLQQFMKMNPFWPGPTPPPASLFGSTRPPAQDPNANATVRGGNNNNPDNKAHSPNHSGKDKNSQPNINSDSSQRKQQQILIQQPLPPSVSPTNLLGPTFIFPLNHQQQQAAAARPSSAKSPAASSASSAAAATSAAAAAAAAAMSFNYPNMAPANETQYVAIMQNNGYPFPMPAVGPPPNYRGPAMPLFNGSFYSPQMIHPSQLLQQNASAPSNSSSSQKHLQSQQQNPSSNKTPPPQQYGQHQSRPRHHLEGDQDNNSSPLTNDSTSRGYRPPMSMYGQNFAMMHPQNFALMTHPPPPQNEKKGAHQGSKGGGESLPQHSFAMSFGPVNGSSGGDMMTSSMAQNQTMFQNSPQNMMISSMAAHKKSFRISDDGKSGSADSSGKAALGGGGGGGGQSIAFTRGDSPVSSSIQANNSVIESSARSLNNASSSAHSSRAVAAANVVGPTSVQNAHIAQLHHHQQQQQQQLQHLQQQQMMQFKQQQHQLAASRSKVVPPPANHTAGSNNNNNIYSDQLNLSSSTMAAKFQNAQNLVHSNTSSNGGAQSPQWRSSATKTSSSLAAPPPTTTATTTLKNIPQHQQHSRNQPQLMHTQISFSGGGSNQKPPSASPQGGQAPPPPSSPMMVGGSPTTSSVSKGGPGGSPRTTSSASTSNKTGQGSSYSVQSIMPNQRSPSILGNPNVTSSSSSAPKAQMPKTMQQTQMFFSNMYSQSQPPHSTSNSPNTSGPGPYYNQRRRQDQLTPGGTPAAAAAAGPTSANTNDPAMAIAAATKGGGGGGLPPSQGVMHAMLPAGFSYVHPVPAAVQAKPSEQKQTAGNDNLHQWQPEKK